jgi:hypothetical protein
MSNNAYEARVAKIDAYRKMRKSQTGKMITRATATDELLDAALAKIEPAEVVEYTDLVSRLTRLEKAVFDPSGK